MDMLLKKTLLTLSFLVLPWLLWGATLSGKVTVNEEPVQGIRVSAYPLASLEFTDTTYAVGPTKEDGVFVLSLPQGQYYLLAEGQGLFAYYGRNPIAVPESGLSDINLLLVPTERNEKDTQEVLIESGIAGIVTEAGQPVAGAIVMVYPDLSSQLKGLGLGMSPPTGEDGRFELALSEGRYYLVVRARQNGMMAGPLRVGDLFGYHPNNPIFVNQGEVTRVNVPVIEVPEKVDRYESSLFGNTSISGRILDQSGTPVAGVRALLYDDPSMLNRPLYVSQPTTANGQFILSFPSGGTYFLAARNELGGTPAPGELYGRYDGSEDHSISVETGKALKDVEIKVEEVY
jgi:hypothetical protein